MGEVVNTLSTHVKLCVEGFGSRDELLVVVHEFHERTVDRDILHDTTST
jgi:hypothetical protein